MAKHDRCFTAPPEDRRLDTHVSDNTRSLGRDLPRDADVITNQDDEAYTAAPTRNGFFGPDSWYMNHEANGAYAQTSHNEESS